MTHIGQWLEQNGLGEFVEIFIAERVDVETLPELTDSDLRELGLPLGSRKKLLRAVRELDRSPATSAPADETAPVHGSSLPVAEAERRQLTVMFCDLVGSTALAESMDAKDYRELLGAYQSAAVRCVQAHDGYVARYMGDGLLVYFGYPAARENDAVPKVSRRRT